MTRFIFRRLLAAVPLLFGVSLVAFLLLHALPGDPARAILGQRATEENVRQFRESQGLNDPLPAQYMRFLTGLSKGEFGRSHRTNGLVLEWVETGGPAVAGPARAGYGIRAVRESIPHELGGSVDLVLAPEGVRCRIELPPATLRKRAGAADPFNVFDPGPVPDAELTGALSR